jgi:hypothetical protein
VPGPPPKAPEDRQRRNKPPALELFAVRDAPPPPAGMGTAVAAEWVAFWGSPLARTVASTDLAALERLFRFRAQQQRLLAEAAAEPLVQTERGLTVNPAGRHALALEPHILHLEDRFSLSPKARLAHGIRLGQAADVAKRHPDVFGPATREPRADPRLADPDAAPAEPRGDGGGLDGEQSRPR